MSRPARPDSSDEDFSRDCSPSSRMRGRCIFWRQTVRERGETGRATPPRFVLCGSIVLHCSSLVVQDRLTRHCQLFFSAWLTATSCVSLRCQCNALLDIILLSGPELFEFVWLFVLLVLLFFVLFFCLFVCALFFICERRFYSSPKSQGSGWTTREDTTKGS